MSPKQTSKPTRKKGGGNGIGLEKTSIQSSPFINSFFKYTPEALIAIDMEYKILGWNAAAEQMYGWTAEELLGIPALDVLKTEYPAGTDREQALSQLITNEVWVGEVTQVHKNGRRIAVHSTVAPARNEKGEIIGMIAVNRDITLEKQNKESARQQSETIEQLMDIVPAAVWVANDPQCKFVHGNRYANELLHTQDGENVSQSTETPTLRVRHFVNGRELGADEMPLQAAVRTGQAQENIEMRIESQRSEPRILLGGSVPLFDTNGKPRGAVATFHDITDLRKEEARRVQLAMLETAEEVAGVGVWVLDLHTQTLTWSDQLFRIFGMEQEGFNGDMNHIIAERVHPDDREIAYKVSQTALEEGIPGDLSFRIQLPDGEIRTLKTQGKVIRDEHGQPLKLMGYVQDISDLVRKDAELRKTQEQMKLAHEAADIGTWENDLVSGAVRFDERASRHYGLPMESTLAEVLRVVHPEDVERLKGEIAAVTGPGGSGTFNTEYRVIHSDESIHWLAVGVRVQFEQTQGGRRAIIGYGTTQDITIRKTDEDTLRESQSMLHSILDAAPDAMVVINRKGEIILANRQVEAVFGYNQSELVGQSLTVLVPERFRTMHTRYEQNFFATPRHRADSTLELFALRKDGAEFPAEININHHKVGGETVAIGSVRDITERKRAQEEIQSLAKFPSENPGPILRLSSDGAILYANHASDLLLQDWGCAVGEPAPALWRNKVAEALSRQNSEIMDVPCGAVIYSFFIAPIVDAGYVNLYGRDITDRKRAEESLRQSEEKFSRAFMTNPAAVVLSRLADGLQMDVNDAYCRLVGYSREELLGHPTSEFDFFIHPDQRRQLVEQLKMEGMIRNNEVMLKNKAGELRTVLASVEGLEFNNEECILTTLVDITDRKQAQADLLAAHQATQATIDGMRAQLCVLDGTGKILNVNRAWREFADANPPVPPNYCVGDNYLETCENASGPNSEEALAFAAALRSVLRGASDGFDMEYACHAPGGDRRWFTAHVARFLSGGRMRVVITHENITGRKLAEDILRASEERYRNLVENIQEVVMEIDEDGKFVYLSPNYEKFSGYSSEEELGTSAFTHVHPEDLPRLMNGIANTNETDHQQVTKYRVQTRNGEWLWIETSLRLLGANDGTPRMIGAARDVTYRIKIEESLLESQSILATAEEVAGIGSWRWDLTTQKVTWSDEMFRLFGVDPEGFDGDLGQVIAQRIHPEDVAVVDEANRSVLEDANPKPLSYRIVLPDGGERTVWAQGKLMHDEQGKPIALAGYVQDISERVRAEAQIQQMKRLYATLSQVNQTIVRVKEQGELFQSICDMAVKFGEFSLAWIGLLDETTGEIKPVAANGMDLNDWKLPIINIHKEEFRHTMGVQAILSGKVMTNVNAQTDPRLARFKAAIQDMPYQATAVVPFKRGGKVIGALGIVSPQMSFFEGEEELALLAEMGMDISFALDLMENERVKQQWADAFEHSAHGMVIVDPKTNRIRACNPAFARDQGATIEELIGTPLIDMYLPEDHDRIKQLIAQSDREGSVQFEGIKLRKDGSTYPFQLDLVSVRDEAGNLLYRVASQQDITERKQVEEKVREKDIQFRKLSANVPDLIYQFTRRPDGSYHVPIATAGIKNVFGCQPEDVVDSFDAIARVLHPDDTERIINDIEYSATHLTQFTCEFRVRIPGKPVQWIFSRSTPEKLPDGSVTWYGFNANITERKQAEKALKRSERVLRLFIEHSPASIAMFDRDMCYIVHSRRYVADYRLPDADLTGRSHYEVFPEIPERWKEIHRRCMEGNIERAEEDPFLRKDGRTDYVHWEIHPWYEDTGAVGGLILFSEVVTERVVAREELAARHRDMVEIARELQESNNMLELIIESAPIRVFWKDTKSRYLGCNLLFARDAGYNHPGEVVGKLDEEFVWKENAETFQQEEREIIETGVPILNKVQLQALPGGGVMWINVSVVPLRDSEGRIIGTMGLYEDITERMTAEDALRKSEARFRALFDDVPIAIWEQDFSEVRKHLNALKAGGVTRFRTHFKEHPEELLRCLSMIRILDLNQAAVRMYEAKDKQELIEATTIETSPGELENGVEELIAIAEGRTSHFWEGRDDTMTGRPIEIRMTWSVVPGYEQDYARVIVTTLDITERKRAEEALLHSKALLTEAQQISHLGNWEWDLQTDSLFWSDEVYRIFGVSPVDFFPTPQSFEDTIHPEDREEFLRQRALMLEKKQSAAIDHRILLPTGEVRHVQERTQLVEDEKGRVARVIGTVQDITERKQAETALKESEERYRNTLDTMQEGCQIVDFDWHYVYVNEMVARHGHVTREALMGHAMTEIYPGIETTDMFAVLRDCMENRVTRQMENEFRFPDGSSGWFDLSIQPVPEGIFILSTDISERKQAETALKESEERYRLLFDHAPFGVLLADSRGKIIEVNPTALSVLGSPSAEATRAINMLTFPPLVAAGISADFKKCIRLGELVDGEYTYTTKWGKSIIAVVRFVPIMGVDASTSLVQIILEDATESKQAEAALTQRLAELELLYQSGLALGGELEPQQVAGKLIEALETKMDWHHIAIRKYEPGSDRLELLAFKQPSFENETHNQSVEERFNKAVTNSSQGLSGWAVRNSQTVRSGDVRADPRYAETYPGIGSGLYAPMILSGRVVGVISVESKELNAFDESVERLLKTVANQAAVAFENARLFQDLQHELLERIQAEKALRESEERFSTAFFTSPVSQSIIAQETNEIMAVNNACCRLFEYEPEELIGASTAKLNLWADPADRLSAVQELQGTGRLLPREATAKMRSGIIRTVIVEITPITWKGIPSLISTVFDITERKRAEHEILQRTQDLIFINTLNDAANRGESVETIINLFTQEAYSIFDCRDAAIYMITPDGKYLEMQNDSLPGEFRKKIEDFIGISIPKIRLPIREGSHTQTLLSLTEGTVTEDPAEIQKWILEFTETTFLPNVLRAPIRAIIPRLFDLMGIRSTITIPLVSSGQTIGLMDFSSANRFTGEDLQRLLPLTRQMTAILLRKNAESNLAVQLKRITALNDIDRAIGSSLDMRLSLEVLLKEVVSQLRVDAADVLLFNPVNQALEYMVGRGFRTSGIRQTRLLIGQGLAGKAGSEQKVLHIPNLQAMAGEFIRSTSLKGEEFVEYFGVPLLSKGALKGVLEIFNRTPLTPDPDWLAYLETLGGQAAIAVDSAELFAAIQRSNQELMSAYDATIAGWSHAMDLRDKETEGHTLRVTELARQLAARMGVSQQEQIQIRRGALLHDIGKLGVPDHILLKPGKLTEEEWEIMRKHPTHAYEMLLPITYLEPALDIPYCHHEKWDGSGYPRGLKGEQIPLAARIFAVVDVWDALRSDRPYRAGWSATAVREHIRSESGKHFDPRVVESFLSMLDESPEIQ